jgi:hypothetical protein
VFAAVRTRRRQRAGRSAVNESDREDPSNHPASVPAHAADIPEMAAAAAVAPQRKCQVRITKP